MPQLVLQADWQEVWHSPQPPFLALSQRLRVSMVTMCSMVYTSHNLIIAILAHNLQIVNYYDITTE
jgi:ABC-type thiamine transport system ATPase subunit